MRVGLSTVIRAGVIVATGPVLSLGVSLTAAAVIHTLLFMDKCTDENENVEGSVSTDINVTMSDGVSARTGLVADLGRSLGAAANTRREMGMGTSVNANDDIRERESATGDVSISERPAISVGVSTGSNVVMRDAVRIDMNVGVMQL